jgi:hypothetical protein
MTAMYDRTKKIMVMGSKAAWRNGSRSDLWNKRWYFTFGTGLAKVAILEAIFLLKESSNNRLARGVEDVKWKTASVIDMIHGTIRTCRPWYLNRALPNSVQQQYLCENNPAKSTRAQTYLGVLEPRLTIPSKELMQETRLQLFMKTFSGMNRTLKNSIELKL